MLQDLLILFFATLALPPVFEGDEEEAVVSGSHEAEQTKACDSCGVFDAWSVRQYLLDLCSGILCPLDRRGVGELKMQEQITLIFIRQEARWNFVGEESRGSAEDEQH